MSLKIGMLLDVEFPPDLRVENEMRTLAGSGYEVHLKKSCEIYKSDPNRYHSCS